MVTLGCLFYSSRSMKLLRRKKLAHMKLPQRFILKGSLQCVLKNTELKLHFKPSVALSCRCYINEYSVLNPIRVFTVFWDAARLLPAVQYSTGWSHRKPPVPSSGGRTFLSGCRRTGPIDDSLHTTTQASFQSRLTHIQFVFWWPPKIGLISGLVSFGEVHLWFRALRLPEEGTTTPTHTRVLAR